MEKGNHLPASHNLQKEDISKVDKYDLLKYELFEQLLPCLLYSLEKDAHQIFMDELISEKGKVVWDLFERLCEDDKVKCPYCADDFSVQILHEGGIEFVTISIPKSSDHINYALRVYIVTATEREHKDKKHTRYFYIKRFVEKNTIHVMYVSPSDEVLVGDELTNYANDDDYERRAVARNFMVVLMNELHFGVDSN